MRLQGVRAEHEQPALTNDVERRRMVTGPRE
jgi:hypothetical protein